MKLCGLDAPRPLDPSLPPRRLSSALCPALPPGSGSRPTRAFAARPRSRGQGPPLRSGPCPDPHRLSRSARGRPFPTASPPARGCAAGRRTVRRSAPEAPGPRAGGGPGSPRAEQLGGRLCPRPRPSGRHGERGRRGRPGRALPDGEVRGRCASGCQPRCSENSHRLLVPTDRTWRRSHSHRPGTVPPHARPREPGPRDEAPRLRDVRVPRGGHSAALGEGDPGDQACTPSGGRAGVLMARSPCQRTVGTWGEPRAKSQRSDERMCERETSGPVGSRCRERADVGAEPACSPPPHTPWEHEV